MKEGSAGLPWTSIVLHCKETLSGPWTEAISRKAHVFGNFPGSARLTGARFTRHLALSDLYVYAEGHLSEMPTIRPSGKSPTGNQ